MVQRGRLPTAQQFGVGFRLIAYGLIGLCILVTGCSIGVDTSSCSSCHRGLELASQNHHACVTCHGGDPRAADKQTAHRLMYGGKNPAAPASWEKGCGSCHRYQLDRVKSGLMYTNTGMIKNIRLTWDSSGEELYSASGGTGYAPDGKPLQLRKVAELDDLAGELYRKFCSRCHVGTENADAYGASHAAGCAACHFPFNDAATYQGNDRLMYGKEALSASHAMATLPDNLVCSRCHSRSGRIYLSYAGLYDGNNALVPTRNGEPGPAMISGGRSVSSIMPDIHFARGMDCIDCHTSRDIMGDGYSYANSYVQVETACQDCHGDGKAPPRRRLIRRENDEALRESSNYAMQMRPGMEMVLTAKGRAYSNAFYRDGAVQVLGKRSGKLFQAKVITGTPEHTIVGHRRMECYACHSHTVVQCYGCHTTYDKRKPGMDFIKGAETPGEFSETEDYRTLYPFPLALNQRGKISPVTPGCQTFVTVVEADGHRSRNESVARFKGRQQLRFAPFYSHNTGKKALGCGECHGNPAFFGFGQHLLEGRSIRPTLLCEKSAGKPLDGFVTMTDGEVKAFAAVTREHSRPLNGIEVRRALSVNLCLVCHDRAADQIYRKELDYRALEDTLHRRLLTGP